MHCVLLGIGLEIGEFLYRYRDIVEPHFKQNDNTFVRCVNIISLQCTLCSDIDIYVCDMNILMHIFFFYGISGIVNCERKTCYRFART